MEKENEEGKLEEVVEGNEVENESCELIYDIKDSEHDPVGEPLGAVFFIIGLESKEAHEGGVCDAQQAGNVTCTDAKHDKENAEG